MPLSSGQGRGSPQARDSPQLLSMSEEVSRPHPAPPPPSNLSPSVLLAPATSLVQNNLSREEASQRPGVLDGVRLRTQHPGLIRPLDQDCSDSWYNGVACQGPGEPGPGDRDLTTVTRQGQGRSQVSHLSTGKPFRHLAIHWGSNSNCIAQLCDLGQLVSPLWAHTPRP